MAKDKEPKPDLVRSSAAQYLTTHQSAYLAVYGEVKRGHRHMEPKAPLACGGETPTAGAEFFSFVAASALGEVSAQMCYEDEDIWRRLARRGAGRQTHR
ncbi:hypothetical protein AXK12_01605 [Cephaloticoccus capnophilus]|uniref:Uncharacterized protein n=1 Tax=Cephaloticoccus capnophilus TaxID=1548208 RepID=A0A139SSW8_9BACT|nr:hypothetical protein [Cephaloticoccus capnophilus]KXU37657.1 hypothetical protein AXK12_01605 [Cephaloticoccus capnophilus]